LGGGIWFLKNAEGYYNTIESINGNVVLMHDIHKKTAEMVKILIPQLLRKGYRFITLNQVQELKIILLTKKQF
jgi:peptidoglycan/xylan/chitin deacetylase (PgdA/CDA1 family)